MALDPIGFRVVSFLVCDDIRQESNGKEILIGVYTKEILVKGFPAKLSQLAFRIVLELDKSYKEYSLTVTRPNKKNLLTITGEGHASNIDDWVHMPVKFGAAEFPEEGTYVVRVALDGRWRKAGEFGVRLPKNDTELARLGIKP